MTPTPFHLALAFDHAVVAQQVVVVQQILDDASAACSISIMRVQW